MNTGVSKGPERPRMDVIYASSSMRVRLENGTFRVSNPLRDLPFLRVRQSWTEARYTRMHRSISFLVYVPPSSSPSSSSSSSSSAPHPHPVELNPPRTKTTGAASYKILVRFRRNGVGIFEENQFSVRYYGKIWDFYFYFLVIFDCWLRKKKEKYNTFDKFLDHLVYFYYSTYKAL